MTLSVKLNVFDSHADRAVSEVAAKLLERRDEIVCMARARHIRGHYEYGDSNLFEWPDGRVEAELMEELADAVVYQAWLLERAGAAPG